jgi:hypothetical protein
MIPKNYSIPLAAIAAFWGLKGGAQSRAELFGLFAVVALAVWIVSRVFLLPRVVPEK